jgi:hypothetical protein
MEHTRISSLPTRLNAEAAWEEYHALAMAADADRRLWTDREHCEAMARAHARWQSLFLAMDAAA